uniref:Uncharacterized protein n=1 Tax=Timema genevievae TaxID=629358 RepID=A0A7R9K6Y5_TIMGE|nr:unnamed protein product [Timema genevievae]
MAFLVLTDSSQLTSDSQRLVLHTSASLALNESWDPDTKQYSGLTEQLLSLVPQFASLDAVQNLGQKKLKTGDDMEMMLNKIVPEGLPYRHSCEGPDDMPAHVKACFLGSSLTIPITDGKLNLGTWQGIWLCEHRDHAGSRKVVITINGCLRDSSRSPMSPVSPMASTSS